MLIKNRLFPFALIAFLIVLPACQPGSSMLSSTPTSSVPPDPLADAWLGEWTVWVQETLEEMPEILIINARASTLEGEVLLNDGDRAAFSAELNSNGRAAVGDWQSDEGKSGKISLLISQDGNQFIGSLQGIGPMCAVRDGSEIPEPCESEFDLDWRGGWYVWLGPLETEALFYFDPEGQSAGPLSYTIKAFVSGENGEKLLGTWESMGSSGEIELNFNENGIQFTGNMDGQFPFCGVRPGGEKPEPCYGP
jgi:hypothetical protein